MHKILVVDDERSIGEPFAVLLKEACGYETHFANSAEAGLRLLSEIEGIRVVISDLQMPTLNGDGFLLEVKLMNRKMTCVLVSGKSDLLPEAMEKYPGVIDATFAKPCKPEVLIEFLEGILKK